MSDTLTILGRVATDPVLNQTTSGVPVTNFRLASTYRRFDNTTQTWVDAGTNWYSIAAFRQLGEHAKASLRTGDAVIVIGKLKIRTWESNGKQGTSIDIDADAIGHDLRWGISAYRRNPRSSAIESGTRGTERPGMDEQQVQDHADADAAAPADPSAPQTDLDTSWADVDEPADEVPATIY